MPTASTTDQAPPLGALADALGSGLGWVCGFRHVLEAGPSCGMHCHLGAEIVFHPTGRGESRVAGGATLRFGPGAVVFYPPWTHHDQRMAAPGTDLCIQFDFRGREVTGLQAAVLLERVDDPALRSELALLAQAQRPPTPASAAASALARAALDHRVTALVIGLVLAAGAAGGNPHPEAAHAERAHDLIAREYATLGRLEDLAERLGVTPDHLRHCFKRRYGFGMARWLTQVRVDRAKDLLMHSALPLRDVAAACGFANEHYLSTVFRSAVGSPPGRFRRATRVRWDGPGAARQTPSAMPDAAARSTRQRRGRGPRS